VFAQRRSLGDACVKVTEATLTYVAVDEERRPRVVTQTQET
jgi:acyl-CoA hydrolase